MNLWLVYFRCNFAMVVAFKASNEKTEDIRSLKSIEVRITGLLGWKVRSSSCFCFLATSKGLECIDRIVFDSRTYFLLHYLNCFIYYYLSKCFQALRTYYQYHQRLAYFNFCSFSILPKFNSSNFSYQTILEFSFSSIAFWIVNF